MLNYQKEFPEQSASAKAKPIVITSAKSSNNTTTDDDFFDKFFSEIFPLEYGSNSGFVRSHLKSSWAAKSLPKDKSDYVFHADQFKVFGSLKNIMRQQHHIMNYLMHNHTCQPANWDLDIRTNNKSIQSQLVKKLKTVIGWLLT